jgi:phosphotransacetylase
MCLEDRVSVFWDCAINPNLLQNNWRKLPFPLSLAFGIEPKIALLLFFWSVRKGDEVDKKLSH